MKLDRDDEEHNYDPFYNPINGGISVSKVNLILNLIHKSVSKECEHITSSTRENNEQEHSLKTFILDPCLSWTEPAGDVKIEGIAIIIVIWTDRWSWGSWRNKWCPGFKFRARRRINCFSPAKVSLIKIIECSATHIIANTASWVWISGVDGR